MDIATIVRSSSSIALNWKTRKNICNMLATFSGQVRPICWQHVGNIWQQKLERCTEALIIFVSIFVMECLLSYPILFS